MGKREIIKAKAAISCLEIFILIMGTISFSYLVYKASNPEDYNNEFESKGEIFVKTFLYYFLNQLKKPIIGIVSAADGVQCCEISKDGSICQQYKADEINSKCESGIFFGLCKDFNQCKEGCCITPEGSCSPGSPQNRCISQNGIWKEDPACNLAQCNLGCCILGEESQFITEKECEKKSEFYNIEPNFKDNIQSELECKFLAQKDDTGACVLEDNDEKTCKFTTRENCKKYTGDYSNFYKDTLCSHPDLGTNCEKQATTGCVQGKSGVYWIDSCANRENIYDSDKEKSWNNGMVLSLENSCGQADKEANANSLTCGNCDPFFGSICGEYRSGIDSKPNFGNYVCRDLDCKNVKVDGKSVTKKNGESWCGYDGKIGEGFATVGSRHYKYTCYNGEVRTEACQDYRNQICVQSDTDIGNGKTFSEASCRQNRWQECINYNMGEDENKKTMQEITELCNENPDCMMKGVALDKFAFQMCVPRYPPGFDISKEETASSAEMLCATATQSCTIIYVKQFSSHGKFVGWKCKFNCECKESAFAEQMNDLCMSLGDCGAQVNYAGDVSTKGYKVQGKTSSLGTAYINKIKQYANFVAGQRAEPGNASYLLSGQGTPADASYKADYKLKNALGVGGVGLAIGVYTIYQSGAASGLVDAVKLTVTEGAAPVPPALGAFANALAAVGSAMIAASILSMGFGMDYNTALVYAGIATAVVYAYAVSQATAGTVGGALVQGLAIFPMLFVGLVAVYVIMKLIGIGDTKKETVTFTCKPWVAPTGTANCGVCNANITLKPCSKYRCESLGTGCKFINEGTDEEKCASAVDDKASPVISPYREILTENYSYESVSSSGFKIKDINNDAGCIRSFSPVRFGIITNEPAECRISTERGESFENMQELGMSGILRQNHSKTINVQSKEFLSYAYDIDTNTIEDRFSDITFYVKCMDMFGHTTASDYAIRMCVRPGADNFEPVITKTEPEDGSAIAYGQTQKQLKIWTDEPSECRYSAKGQEDYNLMEKNFSCLRDAANIVSSDVVIDDETTEESDEEFYIGNQDPNGWMCITNLNVSESLEFKIKCKDKPWLPPENESQKIVMSIPLTITLRESENIAINNIQVIDNVLNIEGSEFFTNTPQISLTIKLATIQGSESGKAMCKYRFLDSERYQYLADTGTATHSQTFTSLPAGNYNMSFYCEDKAGNNASARKAFSVKVDTLGPNITRMYYSGGDLKIITNEAGTCRYSINESRSWDGINKMSDNGKIHSTGFVKGKTFYIKCKDLYGNSGEAKTIMTYVKNYAV
ncbi:MAG: hypothetical protein ACP5OG_03515 [Candidatus Nanoarchaeia archaeon]